MGISTPLSNTEQEDQSTPPPLTDSTPTGNSSPAVPSISTSFGVPPSPTSTKQDHTTPPPLTDSISLPRRQVITGASNDSLYYKPGPSNQGACASILVYPEIVQPYPKARFDKKPQRKGRAKMKSAIWTDTPEKNALEEKKKKVAPKCVKRNLTRNSSKKQSKNITLAKNPSSSSEDDEYFCLVCMEPWSNSKGGEKWVRCLICHLWAHVACTKGDKLYYCHNCESE